MIHLLSYVQIYGALHVILSLPYLIYVYLLTLIHSTLLLLLYLSLSYVTCSVKEFLLHALVSSQSDKVDDRSHSRETLLHWLNLGLQHGIVCLCLCVCLPVCLSVSVCVYAVCCVLCVTASLTPSRLEYICECVTT